jgi:hypothetical protein
MNNYVEALERANAAVNSASGCFQCDLNHVSVRRHLFGIGREVLNEAQSYRLLLSAYNAASAHRLFRSDLQRQVRRGYKYMWVVLPADRELLSFTYFTFSRAMQERGWEAMPSQQRAPALTPMSSEDRACYFRDFLTARNDMSHMLRNSFFGTTNSIVFWFHR